MKYKRNYTRSHILRDSNLHFKAFKPSSVEFKTMNATAVSRAHVPHSMPTSAVVAVTCPQVSLAALNCTTYDVRDVINLSSSFPGCHTCGWQMQSVRAYNASSVINLYTDFVQITCLCSPRGGGLEYLHRRRRKGSSVPEGVTGPPWHWRT
jgi:hypothetical protein